ncbi:MAG TPA: DEAD/DEAH box helicase [Burkholderiaceae bacterium]|nr:DEAD/DEAH box helicase [Burkholderiaceae bacterium]
MLDLDRAFRARLEAVAASRAQTPPEPPLPADFTAELRDYQRAGYLWLQRLAGWGVGALLADDMGLGKTIQALALLAARAAAGPALVVAPTSVLANWRAEARRFAPGLDVRVWSEGDRAAQLEALAAGQVLLVSYGLLALHAETFAARRFATLVVDEAQAIKNADTQRARAVRALQAEFRLALTGTPIENHLGELWSLMQVLNPGLLGSRERFRRRFIVPIERAAAAANACPERELLRRLVAPFLLRRLKSQVLDELPPRTEIVLSIEPSPEEARLLAALRRQARERLQAEDEPLEARRFHVLAELTRLRRAACHPSLVAPELGLTGCKLARLVELLLELKDNRHRALVFSQFVDFLSMARKALDEAGISYQYLDGATAPAAREAAVQAFQRGSGDAFLLSLKAGGVGLNLTGADYVIHLDPWWNPAVEQQATDRAHRIGQTRPVTVYKLVVTGSIEEQIVALHGTKRELVDAMLQDQDHPERLGIEELVALLAEECDLRYA